MNSGNVLLDEPVDPTAFVPKVVRPREPSDVPVVKVKRAKPKPVSRSDLFYRLQGEILRLRPDFSCDWDTTSEALLSQILSIEQDKDRKHYPVKEQVTVANKQQDDTNMQILAGIQALNKAFVKLAGRVGKLEKRK